MNHMKNFPPMNSWCLGSDLIVKLAFIILLLCSLILFFKNIMFLTISMKPLLLTITIGKHASSKKVLPVAHLKTVFLCIKHRLPARQCQRSRAEITALFIVLSDTQWFSCAVWSRKEIQVHDLESLSKNLPPPLSA